MLTGVHKIKATTSLQAGTNPSKSYYMTAGDFLFAEDFDLNVDQNMSIQYAKLVINEKQPMQLLQAGKVIDSVTTMLKEFGGEKVEKVINTVFNIAGKIAQMTNDALTNILAMRYSINPALLYGDNGNASKSPNGKMDPIKIYRNLFQAGNWLNTYEVPYFNENYIEADLTSCWQLGNSQADTGKQLKAITEGIGADYPTKPIFSIGNINNQVKQGISTQFYLINKSDIWLHKNFKFLHALFAGTTWVHMTGGKIKSPNVYHLLCPDRFQVFWAAMSATITIKGKLRKNISMFQQYGGILKSITQDSLWPQAWHVTLSFRSLVPQNFNTYIQYFVHGFGGEDQMKLLQGDTTMAAFKTSLLGDSKTPLAGLQKMLGGTLDDATLQKMRQDAISAQVARQGNSIGLLSDANALNEKQYQRVNAILAKIKAGQDVTLTAQESDLLSKHRTTLLNRHTAARSTMGLGTTQEQVEFNNYVSISQQRRLDAQLSLVDAAIKKDVKSAK